jgi:hypothetical protein
MRYPQVFYLTCSVAEVLCNLVGRGGLDRWRETFITPLPSFPSLSKSSFHGAMSHQPHVSGSLSQSKPPVLSRS